MFGLSAFVWEGVKTLAPLVLLCAFAGAVVHGCDERKYAALNAQYSEFKGGVEAAGLAQFKAAERQAAADIAKKRKADDDNKAVAARNAAAVAGLRKQLDAERDSRGGFVPASPAGSVCPDGLACYDRAELQRAMGDFIQRARGLADEGAALERDLNTAKRWASP